MSDRTAEFLQEQKRLTEAATEGPWERYGIDDPHPCIIQSDDPDDDEAAILFDALSGSGADAEFIAAARKSVPKLIAAVEAVMAVRDLVSRPGDAPHVLSTIAGYNRAMTVVRASIEAALGGEGE